MIQLLFDAECERLPRTIAPAVLADRRRAARRQAAHAWFMQAELGFERYLQLRVPRNLNFNPRYQARAERSMKRFAAWTKQKLLTGSKLIQAYLQVVTRVRTLDTGKRRGDPHWSIAAVARAGMVYHNLAEQLLNIPAPAHLKTPADIDAFKLGIERFAVPLLHRAQARYRTCLKLSGDLRWFNHWSRLCEREINRLEPDRYPLANERRAKPGFVATTLAPATFRWRSLR